MLGYQGKENSIPVKNQPLLIATVAKPIILFCYSIVVTERSHESDNVAISMFAFASAVLSGIHKLYRWILKRNEGLEQTAMPAFCAEQNVSTTFMEKKLEAFQLTSACCKTQWYCTSSPVHSESEKAIGIEIDLVMI
jgi:hypothetical protein